MKRVWLRINKNARVKTSVSDLSEFRLVLLLFVLPTPRNLNSKRFFYSGYLVSHVPCGSIFNVMNHTSFFIYCFSQLLLCQFLLDSSCLHSLCTLMWYCLILYFFVFSLSNPKVIVCNCWSLIVNGCWMMSQLLSCKCWLVTPCSQTIVILLLLCCLSFGLSLNFVPLHD